MKRFISILLAALLIATMLPVSFAAEEETSALPGWEDFAESYNYRFTSYAFGITSAVDPDPTVHSIEAIETLNESKGGGKVSDPWGVLFSYGHASNKLQTNGIRHSSYLNATGDVNANGADGGHVATYDPSDYSPRRLIFLEIKVAKSGTFRPVIEALGDKNNCKMDVYLINQEGKTAPKNTDEARNLVRNCGEENRLGIVDLYSETSESIERLLPSRYVEAGRYWLAFVYNGSNENCVFNYNDTEGHKFYGYYYPYNEISAFRLDNVAEEKVSDVTFTYDLASTNFKLGPKNGTAPEGYLQHQGADSQYNEETGKGNPNRYEFGWVGDSLSAPVIRNFATINTTTYLLPEKTSPWTIEYTDAAHTKIEYNGYNKYFCNYGFNMNIKKANVTGKAAWYPIKLTVAAAGTYKLSLAANYFKSGPNSNVYFLPVSINKKGYLTTEDFNTAPPVGSFNFYRSDLEYAGAAARYDAEQDIYYDIGTVTVSRPGDYYVIIAFNSENAGTPNDSGYYYHELCGIKLTKTGEAPKDTAGEAVDNEYKEETTVETESTAPVSREEESVTVSPLAADVEGKEVDAEIKTSGTASVGSEYTVEASDLEGYTFLYWAKGIGENKRFVSSSKEYTFKPTAGRNVLTAIYRKADSEKTVVVFYNGNGEEVSRRLYNAGDEITVPETPAMAGFGDSSAWTLSGKNVDYVKDDKVKAEGSTMSFVAKYGDVINVTVTTNGTASDANPKYGDDVTVTATLRDASGENILHTGKKTVK